MLPRGSNDDINGTHHLVRYALLVPEPDIKWWAFELPCLPCLARGLGEQRFQPVERAREVVGANQVARLAHG